MKKLTYLLLAITAAICTPSTASAKATVAKEMYMFGFAASFNDTIVHITDIQRVDSTWIDSKSKFLLGREHYSTQMRDYVAETLKMPQRTCITIYSTTRKKIEKEYLKLMRLYSPKVEKKKKKDIKTNLFDVRHINQNEFKFTPVNMSQSDEVMEERALARKEQKKQQKEAKEKARKQKKGAKTKAHGGK
jgi:hypothetical protein